MNGRNLRGCKGKRITIGEMSNGKCQMTKEYRGFPIRQSCSTWRAARIAPHAEWNSAIGFPSPPRVCCPMSDLRFAKRGRQIENLRYEEFCFAPTGNDQRQMPNDESVSQIFNLP